MKLDTKKILEVLNLRNIWIPVLGWLVVLFYQFVTSTEFSPEQLNLIKRANWGYIVLAILVVMARHVGHMYRIRLLTHHYLSWSACFYIITIWEFSSAITPSSGGGGIVAIFLLAREGIKPAKAMAYIMLTIVFDSFLFVLAASPGLVGMYEPIISGLGVRVGFWLAYVIISISTLALSFALFVSPRPLKWLLLQCTRIRFLRRWKAAAGRYSNEISLAYRELRRESLAHWLQVGIATLGAWIARYILLNLLMAAFLPIKPVEHIQILGKQIILWAVMFLSPSPGAIGIAEITLQHLCGDNLRGYTLIVGTIWRLLTFVLYLILGCIFLPRWLRRVSTKQSTALVKPHHSA
ncbi:MAG: lysylphosphatidylglycerol synthase transmembrane domain-containing protein [Bacteroidota bacterium]